MLCGPSLSAHACADWLLAELAPAPLGWHLPCWAGTCPAGLAPALLGWHLHCWAGTCPAGLAPALLGWHLPCWAGTCPAELAPALLGWHLPCWAGTCTAGLRPAGGDGDKWYCPNCCAEQPELGCHNEVLRTKTVKAPQCRGGAGAALPAGLGGGCRGRGSSCRQA
jgi:hypothetical protein